MFMKFFLRITALLFLVTSMAQANYYFHFYSEEKNRVNAQGDLAVIQYYHKYLKPSAYVVIDKKSRSARVFDEHGNLRLELSVKVYRGDELKSGGSGIYVYQGEHQSVHYGKAEKDQSVQGLFMGSLFIERGTPVYVLPESSRHRFRLRNYGLIFNADRVLTQSGAFNYSPFNETYHPSRISVDISDEFLRRYVQALQDEKPKLMRLLKIDNDDYNLLTEFAFGVLSPETNFGKSWKYRIKEIAPFLVSIVKGNGFNTSKNSQGPTQIKRIPDVIAQEYEIEKSDLKEPEAAAITTLAFAAGQLRELRTMAQNTPAFTEENLQDYLYYLYNGRRNELRTGTANPQKSISIRKIKSAIQHLQIEEATEPLLLRRF